MAREDPQNPRIGSGAAEQRDSEATPCDAACLWQVSLHPPQTPYTSRSRADEAALPPGGYRIASRDNLLAN